MRRTRIGLLVDGMVVPAWMARMLESLRREKDLELVLVVRNGAASANAGPAPAPSLPGARWRSVLYQAWMRVDKRRFGANSSATRPVDVAALLTGVPILDVVPHRHGAFDRIADADIARIAGNRLDVLLQLGFGPLRGAILDAARCGVWAHGYCEDPSNRLVPPAVWEVLLDKEATGSFLEIVADDGKNGAILDRSWSPTDAISPARTLDRMMWKTATFMPRRLRELSRIGHAAFIAEYRHSVAVSVVGTEALPRYPDNLTVVRRLGARFLGKIGARLRDMFCFDQWIVLYRFNKSCQFPEAGRDFKPLLPPKDRFWADPCVIQHGGRQAIFIEECEYTSNTGYLSVIAFDQNDQPVLPPRRILTTPYHLSYPFVFEDEGTLYMIPESAANGTVSLYRCRSFPDAWDFVMNLMEGVAAYDATVWRHDGKYWLFATVCENRETSSWDEVFLFYSDALLSQRWVPHPCNPIVSDVRRARPAGRIFEHRGEWYRPAQDCSRRYGRAITVQRIDAIDEQTYRETQIGRIDADWGDGLTCIHTYSRMGGLVCIDAVKRRWKMPLDMRAECGRFMHLVRRISFLTPMRGRKQSAAKK